MVRKPTKLDECYRCKEIVPDVKNGICWSCRKVIWHEMHNPQSPECSENVDRMMTLFAHSYLYEHEYDEEIEALREADYEAWLNGDD